MGELIKVARLGEMAPAYTVVVHGDDIQVDVSEGAT